MENNNDLRDKAVESVVGGLKTDFKIVGSHRVHSWYAWAIIGIVFGMALGVVYVANRSNSFTTTEAAKLRENRPVSESQPSGIPVGIRGTKVGLLLSAFERRNGEIQEASFESGSLGSFSDTGEMAVNLAEKNLIRLNSINSSEGFISTLQSHLMSANPFRIEVKAAGGASASYLVFGRNVPWSQSFMQGIPANPDSLTTDRLCECVVKKSVVPVCKKQNEDGTETKKFLSAEGVAGSTVDTKDSAKAVAVELKLKSKKTCVQIFENDSEAGEAASDKNLEDACKVRCSAAASNKLEEKAATYNPGNGFSCSSTFSSSEVSTDNNSFCNGGAVAEKK